MLVYYDFETTGLNQFHDKIIEYHFQKETTNDSISSLINPQKNIPDIVTRITKITNQMVSSAPTIQDNIHQILQFLNCQGEFTYLVAHNGDNFDFIILREQLSHLGYQMNNMNFRSIDTLLLAKKLYPNLPKHSLVPLCNQLGVQTSEGHRAANDTEMVKNLYHYIIGDLANILGTDPNLLLNEPSLVYNYINGY